MTWAVELRETGIWFFTKWNHMLNCSIWGEDVRRVKVFWGRMVFKSHSTMKAEESFCNNKAVLHYLAFYYLELMRQKWSKSICCSDLPVSKKTNVYRSIIQELRRNINANIAPIEAPTVCLKDPRQPSTLPKCDVACDRLSKLGQKLFSQDRLYQSYCGLFHFKVQSYFLDVFSLASLPSQPLLRFCSVQSALPDRPPRCWV